MQMRWLFVIFPFLFATASSDWHYQPLKRWLDEYKAHMSGNCHQQQQQVDPWVICGFSFPQRQKWVGLFVHYWYIQNAISFFFKSPYICFLSIPALAMRFQVQNESVCFFHNWIIRVLLPTQVEIRNEKTSILRVEHKTFIDKYLRTVCSPRIVFKKRYKMELISESCIIFLSKAIIKEMQTGVWSFLQRCSSIEFVKRPRCLYSKK